MAIKIKQYIDGSMGLVGSQTDTPGDGFIVASSEWDALSVDKVFFVAARPMKIVSIIARVTAAGTNGSAVTAGIKKAASGTDITSGTVLHSGTVNLKGTANTNQVLTLAAAAGTVAAGTCIGIDFTGTLTDATGVVTVTMAPL